MRIEGTKSGFGDSPSKDRVGDKKRGPAELGPAAGRPGPFLEELQAALEEESLDAVDFDALVVAVDGAGKELLAHQDADHLKRYKDAVKKFLLAAVRKAFRVQVVEGRGAQPKLYVMVERIELKLDDLTRAVLTSNKAPLRLLAQIEELRGLLLDLRT